MERNVKLITILTVLFISSYVQASTYSEINDNGKFYSSDKSTYHITDVYNENRGMTETVSSAYAESMYGHNAVGSYTSIFFGGLSSATSVWTDHFSSQSGVLDASVLVAFGSTFSSGINYNLVMYSSEMTIPQIINALRSGDQSLTVLLSKNLTQESVNKIYNINSTTGSDFYLAGILQSSVTAGNSSGYANFAIQTPGIVSSSGTEYPSTPVPEPNQYVMLALGIFAMTQLAKHRQAN